MELTPGPTTLQRLGAKGERGKKKASPPSVASGEGTDRWALRPAYTDGLLCSIREERSRILEIIFFGIDPGLCECFRGKGGINLVGGVINDKDAPGGWGPRWGNRLVLQAAGTATHSCRLGPPPTPLTRLPRHLFFSFFFSRILYNYFICSFKIIYAPIFPNNSKEKEGILCDGKGVKLYQKRRAGA